MTDPGTVGGSSNPEPPPPPSTPPNTSETVTSREAYDGGANERTPLMNEINEQPRPIDHFAPGQNRTAIHKSKLRDSPNHATCPQCKIAVQTQLEYKPPNCISCCNSNYSWWCCLCYSFCWFIPSCAGKSEDVIHHCPICNTVIATYTKFDSYC